MGGRKLSGQSSSLSKHKGGALHLSKRADMSADNKQGCAVADQTDDMIKSNYTSNTPYD